MISTMNSNIENYKFDIDQSKKLRLINPNVFSIEDTNSPSPPAILPVSVSKKIRVKNMPYDEEIWLCYMSEQDFEAEKLQFEVGTVPQISIDGEFLPPTPPSTYCSETSLEYSDNIIMCDFDKNFDIGDGKFEYVNNNNERKMLVNAWKAITETNNWNFLKQNIDSFMWSNDERINDITKKMEQLGYDGHSGTSFGCTMRNMQYLVKNGEEKFKKMFCKINDEDTDEVFSHIEEELEPYSDEDAMEYEHRLKFLIKKGFDNQKQENKILEYMGGY